MLPKAHLTSHSKVSGSRWSSKTVIFFKNWSVVYLQCCVSFRCTTKWLIYVYLYIYIYILCVCIHSIHSVWNYIYIDRYSFRFLSIIGYDKIVPCVMQKVLIGHLFYKHHCLFVNPKFLICPFPHPFTLVTTILFSKSVETAYFY